MKPPILVLSDDVDLFATVEEAERYLEPFMVPDLRIWDSEAYPVSPMIVRKFLAKVVELRDSEVAEPDSQGFKAALLQLIRANENPTDDLDDLPLHDLLTKALKYKTR